MITRPMEQKHLRRRDEPPISGEEPPHHQLLIIRPSALFIAHEDGFSAKFSLLKAYESPLPTETFLQEQAQSAAAVLCFAGSPITADLLRQLPSLGLVATSGTGVNHIDLAACRQRGIVVTNTADYAVGLLIDVMRKITAADGFVRRGLWPLTAEYPLGFKVGGKRVGIVGLGNIGSKDTRHMINTEVMAALGKKGVIVNIARGAIIDEKAMVEHLVARTIAGAALDVFENEPRVPTELFGLDNLVLSPHRGAFTKEAFFDAFQIVTMNIEAFFSNNPLISLVDTAN
ncbi:hypothetical protein SASPL_119530 [Salvia splendens]|uniref:Glyoxylate reductase n=1 Tax=Salvia splendens TaxID=180675 RepID=A0A8X8XTR0_SALSN|nr:hypothetical protein SASPL_119530 [Salvia splendens]